ncbi:MAG: type II toxin-antitoxin system VapC family toxin [Rhizobacter sp.]|nr:type II toxin-antitoxin system VapC family toxin [Chlorobiales bacterium]
MKFLLDTHTLPWFNEDDERLPAKTQMLIEDCKEVYVSVVSLWEIAIKVNIGKLSLRYAFEELETKLPLLKIGVLPIAFADIKTYLSLPLHHRDPFDRMLIAQSLEHDLTLVSKESLFDVYGVKRLW